MTIENQNVIQAPWLDPFPGCVYIDAVADGTINNNTITLIEFEIPRGMAGVIKGFGQEVDSSSSFDDVIWKITLNDVPDPAYGSVVGKISSIETPRETFIMLRDSIKVKLTATSTKEGVKVKGCLTGWRWSLDHNGLQMV